MSINDLNELEPAKNDNVALTRESLGFLNETRKWTMFLAILGFVFIGIMVIFSLVFSAIFSALPGIEDTEMPFPSFLFGLIYLVIAGLYFFPLLYLYKFSTYTKSAILNRDSGEINSAFKNLKSHYRFIGILTIIMLALYPIGIIAMVVGGMASMF
jgi:uncharacterized membrane protein YjgN (DUF898 family)